MNALRPSRERFVFAVNRQDRRAFTLFELVLVLGLIVTLTGLVLPSTSLWSKDLATNQGVDDLRMALLRLRGQAIRSGRQQEFRYYAGTSRYQLSAWVDGMTVLEDRTIPGGVQFEASRAQNRRAGSVLFTPDGTATETTIALTSPSGRLVLLTVDRLTADVEVVDAE
ncbi:pilus assembly FimT family protein [Planctomicrobium sp. SH661]|uniref:pilus assembly FimT family protein n=1 Tax=Planctomicrobium sp. SH661 TaxID=3448124 RepID=UPI003F5C54DF